MTDEEILELEEYIKYENTEIGEVVSHLLSVYDSYSDYLLTDNFKEYLEQELKAHLDNFKEYTVIEEVKEEPKYPYTYKQLFWRD